MITNLPSMWKDPGALLWPLSPRHFGEHGHLVGAGEGGACSSNQPGTSQTGIVTVNRPLDRERIPEYRLTVSVKDNPENPRIARKVRLRETWAGVGEREGRS